MDVPKKMPVCKHSLLVPIAHITVDLQINHGNGRYCGSNEVLQLPSM